MILRKYKENKTALALSRTNHVRCLDIGFALTALGNGAALWNKELGDVEHRFAPGRQGHDGQTKGARRRARTDRAGFRQRLDHEARLARGRERDRSDLDRLSGPRYRARHRRSAARARG